MSVVFRLEAPFRGAYELHRLTYGSGSPSVAIVAGLHGNELNGIHAVNLLGAALQLQRPRGTVHLLPVVNTFGADEGRKRWPFDDRDINRAFPGDPEGTPVQRIAAAVLSATEAEVVVDVHSGSPQLRELPQVRAPLAGRELALARSTGLPVIWRRPADQIDSTGLVGAWREQGRMALHLVGGRGVTLDTSLSGQLARGLQRLLAGLGLLPGQADSETVADITHAEVELHRAETGGFFVPEVRVGDRVKAAQLLGHVQSPIGGERLCELRARRPGVVMTVRAWPMVHAQELVLRLAALREA